MIENNPGSETFKLNHIMPCTLAMLKKLDPSVDPCFHNKITDNVEIVAKNIGINESALRFEIILNDGIHTYSAFVYKKKDGEEPRSMRDFKYTENGYVRIVGVLRKTPEGITLNASLIENIFTRTEANDHLARVLVAYVKLTKTKAYGKYDKFY